MVLPIISPCTGMPGTSKRGIFSAIASAMRCECRVEGGADILYVTSSDCRGRQEMIR